MKKKSNFNNYMKKEYCSKNEFITHAGTHIIIELWHGRYYNSTQTIKKILINSVKACGATLLKISLHKFSPNGGVSGVAIIKESHISIHTWPEYNYAALDIFVCANLNPYKAVSVIKQGFKPDKIQITEFKRGIF